MRRLYGRLYRRTMLITIIKDGKYKKGMIVDVTNNDAHTLIDNKEGRIYENKMMTSERTKSGRSRIKNN